MTRLTQRSAAIAALCALAACTNSTKTLQLTMSVKPSERTLDFSHTATITLAGKYVDDQGNQTPAVGPVALSVDANGSIDPSTVTLDAAGTGSATFTICAQGGSCAPGARSIVHGSLKVGSDTASATAAFTVLDSSGCKVDATGFADCTIAACDTQKCGGTGTEPLTCSSGKCQAAPQSGTTYSLQVTVIDTKSGETPAAYRLPVGGAPYKFVASVTTKGDGKPASSKAVSFTTDAGSFSKSPDVAGQPSTDVTTDANGVASAYLLPGEKPGLANITVHVGSDVSVPFHVNMVIPGTFVFSPASSDRYERVMGVKGSGYNENSILRFALLDTEGNPYTGNGVVNFEVKAPGGVLLSPASVPLDPNGEAVTTLYTGTIATTLAVKATITVGSLTMNATSDTIVIVGAKPSGKNFSVSCGDKAIPALVGNDCAFMRADLTTTCTAVLGDRYNNTLGRKTQLTWSTEAALFGPPSTTPEADPNSDPTSQTGLGRSSNSLRTLNAPMPKDVDPQQGEPSRTADASDVCATAPGRVYNPRDGLNTFIVSTQGEEGFEDANGNGAYDEGEKLYDQGEPFVDANDNGQADDDETFLDVNGNGKWDGPNGKWDADTTIWAVGHVVFTGVPRADVKVNPGTTIPLGGSATITVNWADENLNEAAPKYVAYGAAINAGLGGVALLSPPSYADQYGSLTIVQTPSCTNNVCGLTQVVTPRVPPAESVQFDAPPPPTPDQANPVTSYRSTISLTAALAGGTTAISQVVIDGGEEACNASAASVDCRLASCADKVCLSGGLQGVCKQLKCDTSTAGNGTLSMSASLKRQDGQDPPARIPAGYDPLVFRVNVTSSTGGAAGSQTVTFNADPTVGGFVPVSNPAAAPASSLTATTDASGVATVLYKSGSQVARGQLTATLGSIVVSTQVEVVVGANLTFAPQATDPYYRVMGVRTSGWREQNLLRFRLLDSDGLPYLGRATVTFSVPPSGGVTMIPSSVNIDGGEDAVTTIYSGTGAGTVAVSAATTVNGINLRTTSDTIAIVGAKANGRNIAITCEDDSIPALLGNDCTFSTVDWTDKCTVVLGDRFNNTLGRDTRVFWSTEAALFGPPSSTPLADPDVDPAQQPNLGRSENTLRTLNAPLPKDVPPATGEPQITLANDSCKAGRIANPRDGLVTLLAHTQGEEGFIDDNGNGVYDVGEKFFDLGEPFVDVNDNDVRDADEEFIDVNSNGKYDGPNGKWDADTTIWTSTKVAFTGAPSVKVAPVDAQTGFLPTLTAFQHQPFTATWQDQNLNEPSANFTDYSMSVNVDSDVAVSQLFPAPTFHMTDQPGSMVIHRVTSCDANTKVCSLATKIDFVSRPVTADSSLVLGFKRVVDYSAVTVSAHVGKTPVDGVTGAATVQFAYTPPPSVTSISPSSITGIAEVHLTGTYLGGEDVTTELVIGGRALAVERGSSESDLYVIVDGNVVPKGTWPVTVITSTGRTVTLQTITIN